MSKVKAMWLGPASSGRGTLTDPKTKCVWEAGITIHEIDEADAERLSSGPHGEWDLDPKPAAKPEKVERPPAVEVATGTVLSPPEKSSTPKPTKKSSRPEATEEPSSAPSQGGE